MPGSTAVADDKPRGHPGETPQSYVLLHWGPLWLIQGLFLVVMMLSAQFMLWAGVTSRLPYLATLVLSFVVWSPIFILLRRRRGPITLAERQLAHLWGGNILSLAGLLVAEWMLDLPVLTLAPLVLLVGAATTFSMAAILSGTYYLHTAAHLVGVGLMLLFPNVGMIIVGLVGGAVFIVPGIQIVLRARRNLAERREEAESFFWSADSSDARAADRGEEQLSSSHGTSDRILRETDSSSPAEKGIR